MGHPWTKLGQLASILVLTYACNCSNGTVANPGTLRFVHVVWRHGDRSPATATFPTDTNNPDWSWPQGLGELTEIGVKQQYTLGTILRHRYVDSGFLPKNYNASQIYIRSSDYNRAIMSAQSNLAGMYPPAETSSGLLFQPVPIHVVPFSMDAMLWMEKPCPKADEIYQNHVLKSEEVRRVEEEYADLLTLLRRQAEHPLNTLNEIGYVYDSLNSELIHNDTHTWPDWVTMPIFKEMERVYEISRKFVLHDPLLQRLRGSLLFWDIAQRSEQKAKNDPALQPAALKYYAYSAHDSTMIALLENLGVSDIGVPPYASALMLELHGFDGNYVIQTWYLNETGNPTPVRVLIKNSEPSGDCPLETFVRMARQQTPTDWYAECGFEELVPAKIYKRASIAAGILGTVTALLAVLLTMAMALLMNKLNAARYVVHVQSLPKKS